MQPLIHRFSTLQRVCIFLAGAVLFYSIFFTARTTLRSVHHQEPLEKERELVYITDESQVLPLRSRRHIDGTYNIVDGVGLTEDLFNPALVELPKGSKHDFLIIARVRHVAAWFDGIRYLMAKQVAFFADIHTDTQGVTSLRRKSSARTILDGEFAMPPQHNCTDEDSVRWNINKYIGPEDTRLYWTQAGEPLLQFTSQVDAENECQGIFIVDARAVIPDLVEAFGNIADQLPPIKITRPRQLRRPHPEHSPYELESGASSDTPFQREKNWAPFQAPPFLAEADKSTELMFHVQPYGQRVYRFESAAKYVIAVSDPNRSENQTCFDDRMHQGTPLLSLTLCKRGQCEGTIHNTVLIGIMQKMRITPFKKWYQAHVVTWNATQPYTYRSVSNRITYVGMEEGTYAWTCGLTYQWNSSTIPSNRSHGYLDDWMILTFGISDKGAGWVSVQAEELLNTHKFCTS